MPANHRSAVAVEGSRRGAILPHHATSPYDREVWRVAVILMDCQGAEAAVYAAEQVHAELANQQHSAAVFWSQIAEVVLDWYRDKPRKGEGVQ